MFDPGRWVNRSVRCQSLLVEVERASDGLASRRSRESTLWGWLGMEGLEEVLRERMLEVDRKDGGVVAEEEDCRKEEECLFSPGSTRRSHVAVQLLVGRTHLPCFCRLVDFCIAPSRTGYSFGSVPLFCGICKSHSLRWSRCSIFFVREMMSFRLLVPPFEVGHRSCWSFPERA